MGRNVTGGQKYNNVGVPCWQESVIHICILAVNINVTGGQFRILECRKCVLMKFLGVWKEPVVQSVLSCVLCVLGVNINVTGGQAQKCILC